MKVFVFTIATLLSMGAHADLTPPRSQHLCAGEAIKSARDLFELHYGAENLSLYESDHGPIFFNEVTEKPSVLASNKKTRYSVLETATSVGKMGQYRIRMIYYVLGKSDPSRNCILRGQEILNMSALE